MAGLPDVSPRGDRARLRLRHRRLLRAAGRAIRRGGRLRPRTRRARLGWAAERLATHPLQRRCRKSARATVCADPVRDGLAARGGRRRTSRAAAAFRRCPAARRAGGGAGYLRQRRARGEWLPEAPHARVAGGGLRCRRPRPAFAARLLSPRRKPDAGLPGLPPAPAGAPAVAPGPLAAAGGARRLDRLGAQAADADRDAMDRAGSPTQWLVFARSAA